MALPAAFNFHRYFCCDEPVMKAFCYGSYSAVAVLLWCCGSFIHYVSLPCLTISVSAFTLTRMNSPEGHSEILNQPLQFCCARNNEQLPISAVCGCIFEKLLLAAPAAALAAPPAPAPAAPAPTDSHSFLCMHHFFSLR